MRDLLILAAPALTLWLLGCGWRALSLWTGWRPAAATVWSSDYTDAERRDDFWGLGTLRGWHPFRDGKGARMIEQEVSFEDENGGRHRISVDHRVAAGRRPDTVFTLWYDPANPERVTTFGPGYWLLQALTVAIALVTLFRAGMSLPGYQ